MSENSVDFAGGGIYVNGNSLLCLNGAIVGQQISGNSPDNLTNNGGTVLP